MIAYHGILQSISVNFNSSILFAAYYPQSFFHVVMFYVPWCGHCKKAKPEFVEAADHFKDNRKVYFAGIDCTEHRKSCSQYDVTGYPTFR